MTPADVARGMRVLQAILEDRGERPFRRAHLTEALVRSTNSRRGSMRDRLQWAQSLADLTIVKAAREGLIQRHGRMHWAKACRTLLDDQPAPELPQPQLLSIQSKCPGKWLAVDTETGEIWQAQAAARGWTRAGAEAIARLKTIADKH